MSVTKNISGDRPSRYRNADNIDEKAIMFEWHTPDATYAIDWTWYMLTRDVFESLAQIRWTSFTTIFVNFSKLTDAIYGTKSVRARGKGERAFVKFATGDPLSEMYNYKGRGIYGKSLQLDEDAKMYIDRDEYEEHLNKVAKEEEQRVIARMQAARQIAGGLNTFKS